MGSGSRIGSPVLAPVPSESNYAPSEASVSFAARVGLGMTNDDVIGSYASPLPTAAEEDEEEERASGPEQDL